MGAVVDRSVWTEADLRTELGASVVALSVARLSMLLAAAKEAADEYLCNGFTDDDGTALAIPAQVELGVEAYVRGTLQATSSAVGVVAEGVGSLNRTYAPEAVAGAAMFAARPHWSAYRLLPGL